MVLVNFGCIYESFSYSRLLLTSFSALHLMPLCRLDLSALVLVGLEIQTQLAMVLPLSLVVVGMSLVGLGVSHAVSALILLSHLSL